MKFSLSMNRYGTLIQLRNFTPYSKNMLNTYGIYTYIHSEITCLYISYIENQPSDSLYPACLTSKWTCAASV